MDLETSKKTMSGVCAIGYFTREHKEDDPNHLPDDLEIAGTGFLITDSLICTNKHVIEGIHDVKSNIKDWHIVFFDNLSRYLAEARLSSTASSFTLKPQAAAYLLNVP